MEGRKREELISSIPPTGTEYSRSNEAQGSASKGPGLGGRQYDPAKLLGFKV